MPAMVMSVGDVVLRDRVGQSAALARVVNVVDGVVKFEDIAIFKARALAEAAARELCDQGRVVWTETAGPAYVRFAG
jgi:hypothetical protein